MRLITETFFEPPKTPAELRELMKRAKSADPLQEFSEVAHEELRGFTI